MTPEDINAYALNVELMAYTCVWVRRRRIVTQLLFRILTIGIRMSPSLF